MNSIHFGVRTITRSPIVWGLLGAAAFYGLIHGGPLDTPFMNRYFTHHPVEYGETILFSVGMAALVLRMSDILVQRMAMTNSPLTPIEEDLPTPELCDELIQQLDQQPDARREDYYQGRLRSAIRYIQRLGSAEGLGDELKYLADVDATRAHGKYGLFRVIVWAIPILGFLGTVIGITLALNGIDPKAPDESMLRVITGLGLKFDTTAVALSLSMLLMFVHFFADRSETRLLEDVDRRVEDELAEYIPMTPVGPDGQVVAMRRMAEAMIDVTDRLIERQTELWQSSMNEAASRWNQTTDAAGDQLTRAMTIALNDGLQNHGKQLASIEQSMAEQGRRHWDKISQTQVQAAQALSEGLKGHAIQIAGAEQGAAEQNRRHWEKMSQTHAQNIQALAAVQTAMTHQAEVLQRVIQATGEVGLLQDALNKNLASLSGAKNFEQTVLGLAAAIHLLNARLTDSPNVAPSIQLESSRRTAHAA